MAQDKPGFGEISAARLMRLIGLPDAPVILDLCLPEDVAQAPYRIPTARPASHCDLPPLLPTLQGRTVVVVCQRGKKISHGAAALLRAQGIPAEVLVGGMAGWLEAGYPHTPLDRLPGSARWVTRHRPKIDRIACPWLIRRFVDPQATVLFVPAAEVAAVADRFDAIPFDIPDVPFSHHGDGCTFDTLLSHFELATPALLHLADIVRAADTDRLDAAPQAAGLLAVSVGLSRMFKDDQVQLDAGLLVYDALYRWARDGLDETHDWEDEAAR